MISREEFVDALRCIQYDELMKVHEAAKTNLLSLSKKLDTVKRIEQHMKHLEDVYEEKQNVYNNVNWETSADIDELFKQSKTTKDEMKDAITELKTLIKEAKDIFESTTSTTTTREAEKAA